MQRIRAMLPKAWLAGGARNRDCTGNYMVSNNKVAEILKSWNLQDEYAAAAGRDCTSDSSNRAFYVGNNFVLKVSDSIGEAKNAVALYSAIKDTGVFIPTLLETSDGRLYVRDGDLFFYVIQRVHGSRLRARDFFEEDYAVKAGLLGKTIGQLHLVLRNVDVPVNDANLYDSVQKWALPKAKELLPLSDRFCLEFQSVFGGLYSKLPRQIIHRDPNPSNIIVSRDQWSFIDFELSERSLRIFDPCYAATAILIESFSDADGILPDTWLEVYRNIVSGYDSSINLTEEECIALPYVILANQLISTAWFAEQNTQYPALLETNKYATKWLIMNFDKLRLA